MQPLPQEYAPSPEYTTTNIPSVTIIIPAYNEEKRIGRVLQEISEFITINNQTGM